MFEAANVVCANSVARFMFRAVTMLASVQSVVSYRGADKSLARPGRRQSELVKSVMGRGMDGFG